MDCSICLETLKNTTNIKTQCGHEFHHDCLIKCINNNCPLCRTTLENILPPLEDMVPLLDVPAIICNNCHQTTWKCNDCGLPICDDWDCVRHNHNEASINDYLLEEDEIHCIYCYINPDTP